MIKHADLQKSMAHPSTQPNSCSIRSNDCVIDQLCIFFSIQIMFFANKLNDHCTGAIEVFHVEEREIVNVSKCSRSRI